MTEVLAVKGAGVPPTVRDAVQARVATLSQGGRSVLLGAAVAGPRVEPSLLHATVNADAMSIDECLQAGVLRDKGQTLAFRHELARQAVLESMSSARRRELHRLVLQALCAVPGSDLVRLAEHAEAALDAAAVLAYAPAAARRAAAVGAHREARAHFARAVRFADALPATERATLLEELSVECGVVGDLQAGIDAREQAIELCRQLGDIARQAFGLCRLTSLLVGVGRNDDA